MVASLASLGCVDTSYRGGRASGITVAAHVTMPPVTRVQIDPGVDTADTHMLTCMLVPSVTSATSSCWWGRRVNVAYSVSSVPNRKWWFPFCRVIAM